MVAYQHDLKGIQASMEGWGIFAYIAQAAYCSLINTEKSI